MFLLFRLSSVLSLFLKNVFLFISRFHFNPHMQKMGPRRPKHYIFGDHFYSKKLESSSSMYSSILMLESIWHHFTWSGSNSQDILNGSPETQALYFWRPFFLKKARKLRFHVFLHFNARKHMIFYLKGIEFTRNCKWDPGYPSTIFLPTIFTQKSQKAQVPCIPPF